MTSVLAASGKGRALTVILCPSPTNPEFISSACLAKEQVSEAENGCLGRRRERQNSGATGSKQNGLRGRGGAQAVRSNGRNATEMVIAQRPRRDWFD